MNFDLDSARWVFCQQDSIGSLFKRSLLLCLKVYKQKQLFFIVRTLKVFLINLFKIKIKKATCLKNIYLCNGGDINIVDVVWLLEDWRLLINFDTIPCLILFHNLWEHKNPKQINTPGRESTNSNIIHDHSCWTIRATTSKIHCKPIKDAKRT